MIEELVCQGCNQEFKVLNLGHVQNQGTFHTICRTCQEAMLK
jgi:hypothetical protein